LFWSSGRIESWASNSDGKVAFFSPTAGRYLKLVATSQVRGNLWASAAEIKIYGEPSTFNEPTVAQTNGSYSSIVGNEFTFSSKGSTDEDGHIASYNWIFGVGLQVI